MLIPKPKLQSTERRAHGCAVAAPLRLFRSSVPKTFEPAKIALPNSGTSFLWLVGLWTFTESTVSDVGAAARMMSSARCQFWPKFLHAGFGLPCSCC